MMKLWIIFVTALLVVLTCSTILIWCRLDQQRDGIIEAYDRILKTNTNLLELIKVYVERETNHEKRK